VIALGLMLLATWGVLMWAVAHLHRDIVHLRNVSQALAGEIVRLKVKSHFEQMVKASES
jgi:hypothetical protein